MARSSSFQVKLSGAGDTMATFAVLEAQRVEMLADVARWPARQLAFRPRPDAWTAPEVLDHLVRTERGILKAAAAGLHAPHRRGVRDRLGVYLLDWLFRSDRRVRVPASVATVVNPHAGVDVRAVRRDWDDVRRDLSEFLAPLAAPDLTDAVFKHPVAGWMRVSDVLRFFWVHSHHHAFQLARLRAAGRSDTRA